MEFKSEFVQKYLNKVYITTVHTDQYSDHNRASPLHTCLYLEHKTHRIFRYIGMGWLQRLFDFRSCW
jgi:hypothetical protein